MSAFKRCGAWLVVRTVLIGVLLAASISHAEQNALRAVEVNREGARIVLRLQLERALTSIPQSFSTMTPARLVIDLPDTTNATSTSRQSIEIGDLRHLDIVQAGPRTRVVLNLKRSIAHHTRLQDNEVQIVLGESADATTPAP